LTKTWLENREANFGNVATAPRRRLAQPKTDIAEETNLCEPNPLQTKTLTENLELNFGNVATATPCFTQNGHCQQTDCSQSKPLRTKTLTEK
jgi:hypothetical protein